MRRAVLTLLLAVVAAVALTAPAGAVNIPPAHSFFSSGQIVGGRFVWFQRNNHYKWYKHRPPHIKAGVGALYARGLTDKKEQRVYLPPKGEKIVGFKTGGGRILVGLAKIVKEGSVTPTEVVEITPSETAPWPAKTLASDPDTRDATTCRSRVELVGVKSDGDAILQHDRLEARGPECALARQVGQLTSYAKDGAVTPLQTRKSGWSNGLVWTLLPTLRPTDGDWMLQLISSGWGEDTAVSSLNSVSGEAKIYADESESLVRTEPLTGGGLLLRVWWDGGFLMPSLANPSETMRLWRAGHETWFHACGSQLIEIARSWRRPHHGKWKIYLRNGSGKTTAKLKARLPLGTMFDACDQNTALFHRARHDDGAHQWAVRLAP